MKSNNVVVLGAIGIGLFLLLKNKSATAATNTASGQPDPNTAPQGSQFDLSQFYGQYNDNNVGDLQNLYNSLYIAVDPVTGSTLNTLQIQLLLSQALVESGLFTSSPNLNNVESLNNFAGIKGNSRYPAATGSQYAGYPDISSFVDDWLLILSKGAKPIEATNVTDFVNRLVANSYFTSPPANYISNMQSYFNQLNNVAT